MVRTFLKVYMELGSYFLFLQEQIKDIIIIIKNSKMNAPKKYKKMLKTHRNCKNHTKNAKK